jgi:hypothetical protein
MVGILEGFGTWKPPREASYFHEQLALSYRTETKCTVLYYCN